MLPQGSGFAMGTQTIGSSLVFMATTVYYVIFILVFVRIIISLMASLLPIRGVVSTGSGSFFAFVMDITEPLLKPFRLIIPIGNFGVDFSPFILMYVLNLTHGIILNV
jgi:YggT family protein